MPRPTRLLTPPLALLLGAAVAVAQPQIAVGTEGLALTVPYGETQVLTVPVQNVGTAPLTVTLPQFAEPVPAAASAPDRFGYRWIRSGEAGGPAFDVVDLSPAAGGPGVPLPISVPGSAYADVALPWAFPFYGEAFTSVRVYNNGFLTFDGRPVDAPFSNRPIPTPGAPDALIAPYWNFLTYNTAHSAVYTAALPDGRFVVQFHNVYDLNTHVPPKTFQAALHPDGTVTYYYLDMGDYARASTVGIENLDGTDGLSIQAFNALSAGMALRFRLRPTFVEPAGPLTVTLAPGEQAALPFVVSAAAHLAGTHHTALVLGSDDPATPAVPVPVALTVTGTGVLAAAPAAAAFGPVAVGGEGRVRLALQNAGADTLTVTAVSVEGAGFDASFAAPFTLAPGERRHGVATFAPTALGPASGTLVVTTDVPAQAPLAVALAGEGAEPPALALGAETVAGTAEVGGTVAVPLTITNTGAGPLTYAFPAFADAGRGGGPDAFGYWWTTSDDPNGPAFEWVDVAQTGTRITPTEHGAVEVPLPFAFPFYGQDKDLVRITAHGMMTFGPMGTNAATSRNLPIPNATLPNDLVAVLWGSFWPGVHGQIHHQDLGDGRFVVQWTGVRQVFQAAGPHTFQAILHEDGTILFQYLDIGSPLARLATVGIENAAGTDGLEIAYARRLVESGLAIRISTELPYVAAVSPASGEVAPGTSAEVAVTLDAAGLTGGTYAGTLVLETNDPAAPRLALPVALTAAGEGLLAVDGPAEVDFEHVVVGQTAQRRVVLRNDGTAPVTLGPVTASAPFTVGAVPPRVEPGETATLTVRFAPGAEGAATGTLSIGSDAADAPALALPLAGSGVPPPTLIVAADTLVAMAASGQAAAVTFTIENPGPGPLHYRLPQLDRGGVAGRAAGGPDPFGYTWLDSEEPGGPAFEWVDLREIGELLPTGPEDTQGRVVRPLPFTFYHYGQAYDAVRVQNSGYLTFLTEDGYGMSVRPIPSHNPPNAFIAPFWASGLFDFEVHDAVLPDGRYAVQWLVGALGQTNAHVHRRYYRFQAVLSADDGVRFYYERMDLPIRGAHVVGMEDASGTTGLQVHYGAFGAPHTYLDEQFAIEILPPTRFFGGAAPASGWVEPGGSAEVTLTLDAGGLVAGTYRAALILTTNDPAAPRVDLPVAFTVVGAGDLVAAPASVAFGPVFVGGEAEQAVTLTNPGTDAVAVAAVEVLGGAFALAEPTETPFALAPGAERALAVRFAPEAEGPHAGTLRLSYDADGPATLDVPLAGSGVPPPVPQLSHAVLQTAVAQHSTGAATVTLTNAGASPLAYTLALVPGGLPVPEPAPRPARTPRPMPEGLAEARWGDGAPAAEPPSPVEVGGRNAPPGTLLGSVPFTATVDQPPIDLTMTPEGHLLVAAQRGAFTRRYGRQLQDLGTFTHPVAAGNRRTFGVSYNEDTRSLWYLDIGANETDPRLIEAALDGAPTGREIPLPTFPATAYSGLSYNERTQRYYVLDTWGDDIFAFDASGALVPGFPVPQTSADDGAVTLYGRGIDALGDFLDVPFGRAGGPNRVERIVTTDLVGVDAGPVAPLAADQFVIGGPLRDRLRPNDRLFLTRLQTVLVFQPAHRTDFEPFVTLLADSTGTLAPGASVEVALALDPLELPLGIYGKRLRVETNAPQQRVVATDVEVRVLPPGATSADDGGAPAASAFEGAHPNPFAQRVALRYTLAQAGPVRIEVFDVMGRRVGTVVDAVQTAGAHEATFDGAGLAAGVYVVAFEAGEVRQVRRVTLLR